jgi:hypothetical protein
MLNIDTPAVTLSEGSVFTPSIAETQPATISASSQVKLGFGASTIVNSKVVVMYI